MGGGRSRAPGLWKCGGRRAPWERGDWPGLHAEGRGDRQRRGALRRESHEQRPGGLAAAKGLDLSDVRLLGDHRDAAGKRRLELKQAVALMKNPEDKEFPIHGVRAAKKEFHESVAASAGEFLVYHAEWVRLSGVSKKTSAAHIHRALCEALRLMHSFDQIDTSAIASGEHLTRWLIQTELAVERNPQQPDFSGLDIISGTAQLPDGRDTTSKFTDWVSNRLKERAAIWKQERLYNQERRHLRGPRGGRADHGDSSDDEEQTGLTGARKKKKKKKGGKGEGSGDAAGAADAK